MVLLSDNPWPIVWTCLAIAGVLLIAMRITGRGKFLIFAVGSLGLAWLALLVDHLWVTDAERIEVVVRNVADAAQKSDAEAFLSHLTTDVVIEEGSERGLVDQGEAARRRIRSALEAVRFEFVRVQGLTIHAAPISRMGTADFRAALSGTYSGSLGAQNFTLPNTEWSFGLREVNPGDWKVNRITAIRFARGVGVGSARLP